MICNPNLWDDAWYVHTILSVEEHICKLVSKRLLEIQIGCHSVNSYFAGVWVYYMDRGTRKQFLGKFRTRQLDWMIALMQ